MRADALVVAVFVPHVLRKLYGDGVLSMGLTTSLIAGGRSLSFCNEDRETILYWGIKILKIGFCFVVLSNIIVLIYSYLTTNLENLIFKKIFCFYSYIVSPYYCFILLSSYIASFLYSTSNYKYVTFSTVYFNLSIIIFILVGITFSIEFERLYCAGFVLASIVQFVYVYILFKKKIYSDFNTIDTLQKKCNLSEIIKKGVYLTHKSVFSVSTYYISLILILIPSIAIGNGTISSVYFADRIIEMPMGLIASCLGIVTLTDLSCIKKLESKDFSNYLRFSLHYGLFFSIPVTIGIGVIAPDLIDILLNHGNFTQEKVQLTSYCLWALLPSLPFFVLQRILVNASQACGLNRVTLFSSWLCLGICAVGSLFILIDVMFFSTLIDFLAWTPFFITVGLSTQILVLIIILSKNDYLTLSYCKGLFSLFKIMRILLCGIICGITAYFCTYFEIFNYLNKYETLFLRVLSGIIAWCVASCLLCREEFNLIFSSIKGRSK